MALKPWGSWIPAIKRGHKVFFQVFFTKYSCIDCGIVVCNVCAVSIKSNYSEYEEELKKVGICKKCSKKEISIEQPSISWQSSSVSASSWKTTLAIVKNGSQN